MSRAGRRLELETRLRLRDGERAGRIIVRQRWRCERDRKGEFTGIRPIKRKLPTVRPGLSVHMKSPRLLPAGRKAKVRVVVTNKRRPRRGRAVSSLWNLRITGSAGGATRTIRVKELRARHSRTLRLRLPVALRADGRVCVRIAADADSARSTITRRCTQRAATARSTP